MTSIALRNTFIKGHEIPTNAIIFTHNEIILYCTDFRHKRAKSLHIMKYDKVQDKFIPMVSKSKTLNDMLWTEYRKFERKHRKHINSSYLKHERKHKKSRGGQRDNIHTITDYECTKNPLHDFRICYN